MSEPTTTPTTTPAPSPATSETTETTVPDGVAAVCADETEIEKVAHEFRVNLAHMVAGEDKVTRELATEIIERMCLLSRRFDIPYTEMFPFLVADVLMIKWRANATQLKDFIEEGGAKAQLDALYEAEGAPPAE